jgi:hypothetical protein
MLGVWRIGLAFLAAPLALRLVWEVMTLPRERPPSRAWDMRAAECRHVPSSPEFVVVVCRVADSGLLNAMHRGQVPLKFPTLALPANGEGRPGHFLVAEGDSWKLPIFSTRYDIAGWSLYLAGTNTAGAWLKVGDFHFVSVVQYSANDDRTIARRLHEVDWVRVGELQAQLAKSFGR